MTAYPSVAYFCMEYGLDARLRIYSGGLGVLAGDIMKSVGDLHLPVVGIGLLWGEGYAQQHITEDGKVGDHWMPQARDALAPVDARVVVRVRDREVPLRVFRVTRFTEATLYLLEPELEDDRWITRRLYGGGTDDRLAQEIVLGIGGVRLLRALGLEPDLYHFNEGHAVFAGLELVRERRAAGESLADAVSAMRSRIVFTTHTPVPAGNEEHELDDLRRMGAALDFSDGELEAIGGDPFSMTAAGLRLAATANAVAELHGDTARAMWKHIDGAAPILSVTNGVHQPTWQDARVRAALVVDKAPTDQAAELWEAHQRIKRELIAVIHERTGQTLQVDRLLVGFARRAATYKRADLILGDPERLQALFARRRLQLVFAGKAHPADAAGRLVIERIVEATRLWPDNVVFLENYDMELGALLTRGCDVWLNNPRRPMEASGTSGMKAAMNGVLNLSILDGWWPEGCRHGETGWRIGGSDTDFEAASTEYWHAEQDGRDRETLYETLEREVMPRYYDDHHAWVRMMQASVAMAQWRFSSDRMVQDYYRLLYRPAVDGARQTIHEPAARWNRRWRARASR